MTQSSRWETTNNACVRCKKNKTLTHATSIEVAEILKKKKFWKRMLHQCNFFYVNEARIN